MTRREKAKVPELEPTTVGEAWKDGGVHRAVLLEGRPVILQKAEGGDPELWLELLLGIGGHEVRLALLLVNVDPYLMAAEIMGAADGVLAQALLDRSLDAAEQQEVLRRQRLRARRRREEVKEQVAQSGATSCDADGCQRGVAFIVEGMRLCKRHAEELGVRPTGRIGMPEDEPGEGS